MDGKRGRVTGSRITVDIGGCISRRKMDSFQVLFLSGRGRGSFTTNISWMITEHVLTTTVSLLRGPPADVSGSAQGPTHCANLISSLTFFSSHHSHHHSPPNKTIMSIHCPLLVCACGCVRVFLCKCECAFGCVLIRTLTLPLTTHSSLHLPSPQIS